jgi:hypothetical protein
LIDLELIPMASSFLIFLWPLPLFLLSTHKPYTLSGFEPGSSWS